MAPPPVRGAPPLNAVGNEGSVCALAPARASALSWAVMY